MPILRSINAFLSSHNLLRGIRLNVSNCKKKSCVSVLPQTKYGGRFTVTMIAGDGYGPQMMGHVKDIFRTARVPVDFEEVLLNSACSDPKSVEAAVLSAQRNGVAIKGNILTNPDDLEFHSRNVLLRTELNLFANVLHCKSHPGIRTRHERVDIVLIRQNTEGEYSCLEHSAAPGVVESLKVVTRARSEEIALFAFEYSAQRKRRKITAVHKTSVMPLSDGLFLSTCMDVAKMYPQIDFEPMFLDTCCSELVSRPRQFDVLLLPNLYGNVLNGMACGLVGGAGTVPGMNYGPGCAVFEVGSRSSAVTSTNPVAMLNAGVDLLRHLGLDSYAHVIEEATNKTLFLDKILPQDLGGSADDALKFIDRVTHYIRSSY